MKRLKTITRPWGDKLTVTASKKAADLDILTVMCLNRAVYGENKLNRCFYKDKRRTTKLLEMMVCYLCIGMNAAFPDGTRFAFANMSSFFWKRGYFLLVVACVMTNLTHEQGPNNIRQNHRYYCP